MEIKLDVDLKDGYGEVFKVGTENLTLEKAIYQALVQPTKKDQDDDGSAKYARHKITEKIVNKKKAELTIDELKTIKDRVGNFWGVPVVGAIYDIIEK